MKNKIINFALILLCVCAIEINMNFEQYKAIGIFCIILMGVLGVCKGKKDKE